MTQYSISALFSQFTVNVVARRTKGVSQCDYVPTVDGEDFTRKWSLLHIFSLIKEINTGRQPALGRGPETRMLRLLRPCRPKSFEINGQNVGHCDSFCDKGAI